MSQNNETDNDRGSTFTFWIESIPGEWTQLKQRVNYDDSMGDLLREAVKIYVDLREIMDEHNVEWSDEERRHHVRRYVKQGLAQELEAN